MPDASPDCSDPRGTVRLSRWTGDVVRVRVEAHSVKIYTKGRSGKNKYFGSETDLQGQARRRKEIVMDDHPRGSGGRVSVKASRVHHVFRGTVDLEITMKKRVSTAFGFTVRTKRSSMK